MFRPSTGTWYINLSGGGSIVTPWGASGDPAVPADFDGDGKSDIAVFRPSTGTWYINLSGGGSTVTPWGPRDIRRSNSLWERSEPCGFDGTTRLEGRSSQSRGQVWAGWRAGQYASTRAENPVAAKGDGRGGMGSDAAAARTRAQAQDGTGGGSEVADGLVAVMVESLR